MRSTNSRNPEAVRWASASDRDALGKVLTMIVVVPLAILASPMIGAMLPSGTGQFPTRIAMRPSWRTVNQRDARPLSGPRAML
jgi:hypothetical protein